MNHLVAEFRLSEPLSFTTNVFSCFLGIMASFVLVRHKFQNYTMKHIHLCIFQIPHGVKQCSTCQCTNYHDTTNESRYLGWHALLLRTGTFHSMHYYWEQVPSIACTNESMYLAWYAQLIRAGTFHSLHY